MTLKNNLLALSLVTSFLFRGLYPAVEINSTNLSLPSSLRMAHLHHDETGFSIEDNGAVYKIKTECIDKSLRNLSDENLEFLLGVKANIEIGGEKQTFTKISATETQELFTKNQEIIWLNAEDSEKIISQLPASSYLEVFQYRDGEFGLHLRTRALGGGFWGAAVGAWTGKFVVHLAAQAGIVVVGTVVGIVATPAAGIAVAAALEHTVAPAVEAASVVVGVAAGIAGAVATGPV